ncbi:MAG: hypothetical protein JST11_04285 [Acidobacteria bacterium]|nr:hypothetical protein [Acidobacteriota bacterium]
MSAATPFRWPGSWTTPDTVDLLQGTAVDLILLPEDRVFDRVRARARERGIASAVAPPEGVAMAPGAWPGVKLSRGGEAEFAAGPTGVPWVDSNGWLVRLMRAMHPGAAAWIDAPPKDRAVFPPASYELAVADAAAHGGRWILALDSALASHITPDAPAWKRMMAAASFFAARRAWMECTPAATLGVVSDFSGPNEFMGQELLNLVARSGQQYRVVPKARPDFAGLRAILYADRDAPSPALRRQALAFVEAGGLLIAAPVWGAAPGREVAADHPRFALRAHGKGRIALAHAEPDDPWMLANDSAVLVSHRYDLVRCFNSGSFGACYTVSPDRVRTVVHVLFYADRGPSEAAIRIAGSFRTARISTIDRPDPQPVRAQFARDAVEVHLPPVPPYVAIELTA